MNTHSFEDQKNQAITFMLNGGMFYTSDPELKGKYIDAKRITINQASVREEIRSGRLVVLSSDYMNPEQKEFFGLTNSSLEQ